ncbi:MAG TPA: metallophosphoesterase family protein [Sphingobium sp.]|uniref:metallophosphoesterase family protein n=1 Tax=Sphingobium sp. TaxID=1912891 RepID=UPI002ED4A8C1
MFNLFRRAAVEQGETEAAGPRSFSIGEGARVYAIGDVHGRRDLLVQLLRAIVADHEGRGSVAQLRLVLLGDLIDRGPDSAAILDLVMAMMERWPGMECLQGNHEEVFLLALQGNVRAMQIFRRFGGETLSSYGIDPALIAKGSHADLHAAMLTHVPEAHRDFLAARPNSLVIGDYCFVHAGIRPGVPLDEQEGHDLRWIREDFLSSRVEHPHMIVHGHSVTKAVDARPNRIGIDTGAYASDRLTAIGLEGTERWFLTT